MAEVWPIYPGKGAPSAGLKVGWAVIVAVRPEYHCPYLLECSTQLMFQFFAVAYIAGLGVCLPRQGRLEFQGRGQGDLG